MHRGRVQSTKGGLVAAGVEEGESRIAHHVRIYIYLLHQRACLTLEKVTARSPKWTNDSNALAPFHNTELHFSVSLKVDLNVNTGTQIYILCVVFGNAFRYFSQCPSLWEASYFKEASYIESRINVKTNKHLHF